MTKIESCVEFIGTTVFRATLIIACTYVGASLARAEVIAKDVAPAKTHVPNLVVKPDFESDDVSDSEDDQDVLPSEKLQYEPVTEDTPVISERNAKTETGHAVEYEAGTELMVSPAPDFAVKDEKIDEQVAKPDSEVSLAPAATDQR